MIIEAKVHDIYQGNDIRGSKEAAGIDLRAVTAHGEDIGEHAEVVIEPGGTAMIGTGIALDLGSSSLYGTQSDDDVGLCALVLPRSGLGCKGLKPGNSPGLIDADYHGEIKVCLTNQGTDYARIKRGDRIAQLVIVPYFMPVFSIIKDFSRDTERGDGGFGSTGA